MVDVVAEMVIEGLCHDYAWVCEEYVRTQWLLQGALVEMESRRLLIESQQRTIDHQREQIRALLGADRPELDDLSPDEDEAVEGALDDAGGSGGDWAGGSPFVAPAGSDSRPDGKDGPS